MELTPKFLPIKRPGKPRVHWTNSTLDFAWKEFGIYTMLSQYTEGDVPIPDMEDAPPYDPNVDKHTYVMSHAMLIKVF